MRAPAFDGLRRYSVLWVLRASPILRVCPTARPSKIHRADGISVRGTLLRDRAVGCHADRRARLVALTRLARKVDTLPWTRVVSRAQVRWSADGTDCVLA